MKEWEIKAAAEKKLQKEIRDMAHAYLATLSTPRQFDVRIILYPHENSERR